MLWQNVRKLNEAGKTIILTTHYLEEAEAMCDEIAIIHHGEVLVRDTTRQLLSRIDTKTLVIEPAGPAPAEIALPPEVEMDRRSDGRLAFDYAKTRTKPGDILASLRDAGVEIADVSIEEPHLEDVFLELTRADPDAAA